METPKSDKAFELKPSPHVIDTIKELTEVLKDVSAKPKPIAKPKTPYFPKNQPLRDHSGLMALKQDLEKR